MENRFWLDVPFSEKDAAKTAGARWDPAAKRWYAPQAGVAGLARWSPQPNIPPLLPGEDRHFGSGLFVDLVPRSCWFTNVRYCIAERDWERLRRMLLARADRRCEACGRGEDREVRRWLEAHERWSFDPGTRTQTLKRLICLCSDCHRTTHYGLAQIRGQEREAFDHLKAVTGLSDDATRAHITTAFDLWAQRSRFDWHLDLSILTSAGITLTKPPQADTRTGIADRELRRTTGS